MGPINQERKECLVRDRSAPTKFVCANCVEDSFLKKKIAEKITPNKCDYCCKANGNGAAPLTTIMGPIESALFDHFMPLDTIGAAEEGDKAIQEECVTTAEALLALPLKCDELLFNDVSGSIANALYEDAWIENTPNFYGVRNSMLFSWGKFVQLAKHRVRFFLTSIAPRYHFSFEHPPAEFLNKIGQTVTDIGLINTLDAGEILFRVRYWPNDKDNSWPPKNCAKEMGAPPNNKALSQRMSPAGISYMYLAKEEATALAEVANKPPCQMAIAYFKLLRKLQILDLSQPLELPSVFDENRRSERELLSFISDFADAISEPVQKDGREHIDYVPTQIVSEYFAKVFKVAQMKDGKPLDGVAYKSAVRPGGTNIVLFPPQKERISAFLEFSGAELVNFDHWDDVFDAVRFPTEQHHGTDRTTS